MPQRLSLSPQRSHFAYGFLLGRDLDQFAGVAALEPAIRLDRPRGDRFIDPRSTRQARCGARAQRAGLEAFGYAMSAAVSPKAVVRLSARIVAAANIAG